MSCFVDVLEEDIKPYETTHIHEVKLEQFTGATNVSVTDIKQETDNKIYSQLHEDVSFNLLSHDPAYKTEHYNDRKGAENITFTTETINHPTFTCLGRHDTFSSDPSSNERISATNVKEETATLSDMPHQPDGLNS